METVRQSRRCFSAASGAGGETAVQRCSRAAVELRHAPSADSRYGQMVLTGSIAGAIAAVGAVA